MNYLKACLSVFLISGVSLQLFSQQLITGKVYTNYNEPIPGVFVTQGNNNLYRGTQTDIVGQFTFLVNEKEEKSIKFSFLGYVPFILSDIDTISHPLSIIMEEYPSTSYSRSEYPSRNYHHFGYTTTIGVEQMYADFSEFESALGSYNTKYMSGWNATLNLGFALTYQRFLGGIGIGGSFYDNSDNDSLKIVFNIMQYNIDFGYELLNSKRLVISPIIGLKWKRYRLINRDSNKKIPIETYLSDRDLDIRFNQTYSSAGLRIVYNPKNPDPHWRLGIDGGYILPLNKVPWTYSRRNLLITDKELRIDNYFFRFYLAMTIE